MSSIEVHRSFPIKRALGIAGAVVLIGGGSLAAGHGGIELWKIRTQADNLKNQISSLTEQDKASAQNRLNYLDNNATVGRLGELGGGLIVILTGGLVASNQRKEENK